MQSREERIARNDSTFRDANEKIAKAAGEYELVEEVPFICECATESCTDFGCAHHPGSLTIGTLL